MVHGFYALMGGMASEIPQDLPEHQQFLPSHRKETWFLTSEGALHLAKPEIDELLKVSEDEIKSKSKANGIAKGLVCIQTSWFLVQYITRRM